MDFVTLISSISLLDYRTLKHVADHNAWAFFVLTLYSLLGFFVGIPLLTAIICRIAGWLYKKDNCLCKWLALFLLYVIRIPLWSIKKALWVTRLDALSPSVCRAIASEVFRPTRPLNDSTIAPSTFSPLSPTPTVITIDPPTPNNVPLIIDLENLLDM